MKASIAVSTTAKTTHREAFDYISDLTRHGEWATDELKIVPVNTTSPKVGAAYKSAGAEPFLRGRLHHMDLTVTDIESPTKFSFDSTDGMIIVHHDFTLTEVPDGTRIERVATWTKRPLIHHVLWPLLLQRSLHKRFGLAQERLKEQLESRAAHTSGSC